MYALPVELSNYRFCNWRKVHIPPAAIQELMVFLKITLMMMYSPAKLY